MFGGPGKPAVKELSDSIKKRFADSSMRIELYCPDGWVDLVNDLEARLAETDPDHEIHQVKEKFGGLRYYTGGLSEAGHRLIEEYENKSTHTCQVCGAEGERTTTGSGWMATLCEDHKKA